MPCLDVALKDGTLCSLNMNSKPRQLLVNINVKPVLYDLFYNYIVRAEFSTTNLNKILLSCLLVFCYSLYELFLTETSN